MGMHSRKKSTAHKLGWQARGAAAGFGVAVLVMGGLNLAGPSLTAGTGSLPLVGSEFAAGDGESPGTSTYGVGPQWNVYNWGPGAASAVASSFSRNYVTPDGWTKKKINVSSGANADVAAAATQTDMFFSDDSGITYMKGEHNYPVSAINMIRLQDGSQLAIGFIPKAASGTRPLTIEVSRSADGKTWTTQDAPVTFPAGGKRMVSLRVHRRPMQLPDGTLMVPAYGAFVGDRYGSSIILQSTDGGNNWTLRSTISGAEAVGGVNEVGWSYVADGRLLAVVRGAPSPNMLFYSYSSDDGKTWTNLTQLLGPDGKHVQGIFPDLVLQPNGILLLATGRPDVRALISYDGTGSTWDVQRTVFANYPSDTNNGRYDGTSGNTSLENVASNRTIQFFDQCHMWGCGAYNQQFGIAATYLSVVTKGVGRLDLNTLAHNKNVTFSGDFAPADPAFPEQRPEGVFDGSSAPGAEAVLQPTTARAPSMTIKLDKAYPINRIGLMLGHGQAQSATVQLSSDGVNWGRAVVTRTNTKDRAMRYDEVKTTTAQYVRITGARGANTTVTELELYADSIDTFENDPAFEVPRGWTAAKNSWITDVPDNVGYSDFGGYQSATALRLWDKWEDQNATITRPLGAPTGTVDARMQWGTSDPRAPFTVELNTAGGDGSATPEVKFQIIQATTTAPQQIQAWDGAAWQRIGTVSKLIPGRTYVPMRITADATSATLELNGEKFTTSARAGNAGQFSSLTFTTGDPKYYGGIYYLDNVQVDSR
ncbi:exo-alpha-sialidase [Nakamurella aerolata]|uniref:Exo-alpha-sialidase n=1 Tax=Nakamurella aerolata TaxID=1656892 RepID=A0A849A247_9ACTN|nr:exo-alpha-sialidase [Nakamurella aerolata]NNG35114.1 exo-alpha-sialidase [Nakamurella aerolata]